MMNFESTDYKLNWLVADLVAISLTHIVYKERKIEVQPKSSGNLNNAYKPNIYIFCVRSYA